MLNSYPWVKESEAICGSSLGKFKWVTCKNTSEFWAQALESAYLNSNSTLTIREWMHTGKQFTPLVVGFLIWKTETVVALDNVYEGYMYKYLKLSNL